MLRHPASLMVTGLTLAFLSGAGLPSTPASAQAPEYVVGPQDVLAVTVTNEPTLTGKFTVVADGTVAYPLLGSVKVGGLSLRAVERELTTRLADGYLEKPLVSVALDQFGSQRVLVIGEVRQAGSYPLSGPTTLLEILLKAGAPTATAGAEALVVRGRGSDPRSTSTSAGRGGHGARRRTSCAPISTRSSAAISRRTCRCGPATWCSCRAPSRPRPST